MNFCWSLYFTAYCCWICSVTSSRVVLQFVATSDGHSSITSDDTDDVVKIFLDVGITSLNMEDKAPRTDTQQNFLERCV